jgi:exosortase/archaeosortase family protein
MASLPHRTLARRIAIFAGAFLLLTTLEFALRDQVGPFVNGVLNVRAGAAILRVLAPAEHVQGHGDRIESATTSIRVSQGCEGVDVMFMFVAAMLAMPMTGRRRLVGCIAGVGVIYACNLVRLAGLWYCLKVAPERFESMHVIVGQTAIIVVAVLLFAGATGSFARLRDVMAPGAEEIR